MRSIFQCVGLLLVSSTSILAQTSLDRQAVAVGPWSIATNYKADRFEYCTMTRSTPGLGVVFVRNRDGLLLTLDLPDWKLERGKAYTVRLAASSLSVEAKALAETQSVTIALADKPLNENIRSANVLEVRGEGTTLRVPLDGSSGALARLDQCFEKNSREGPQTNPFVAPNRRP